MSPSVSPDTPPDSRSSRASVCVKRKPPPAGANAHRPASSSTQITLAPQQPTQQANHQSHKLSFSERYPEPDPTDPFAPLWVLRNRTSSALHREGPPVLSHLLQPRDTDEFGIRQPDRRRSISYLQTLSIPTATEGTHPLHASDHGHEVASMRLQRTHSTDAAIHLGNNGNGNLSFLSTLRRQSAKPTPLSQVTALTTPSASRGSVGPAVAITPTSPRDPQRPPTADGSGTESDTTRVGLLDVDATPRAVAQPSSQTPHDRQPSHQQQEERSRARTGSANKLTRFLKARKASQSDSNSHNVRASITDINRIRKASISPPIFSTVVWAGHGGELAPIKDHPLQQNAISIVTAAPDISEVVSPLHLPPQSCDEDAKQGLDSPVAAACLSSSPIPNSISTEVLLQHTTFVPPPLALRPSTAPTHAYTEESNSTSSFVHVPTAISSPSFARLAVSQMDIGPGVSATIASPATIKIRRTSSRPMSKLPPSLSHSTSPLPLTSSIADTLSSVFEQPNPVKPGVGEWDIPTLHSLTRAASLPIIAESGVRITFGTLFARQKVVVLFIRHFWCPLCQDYMTSVASLTRQLGPEVILSPGHGEDNAGQDEKFGGAGDETGKSGPVKLVVISNGSYTMIGKYKQIFGSGAIPLDVYTDPSLAVYTALGMGKDPASLPEHQHLHSHGRSKSSGLNVQGRPVVCKPGGISCSEGGVGGEKEKTRSKSGGYVRHGLMAGIAMVFVRALKVGMPVWEKGGDLNQLGGEFVLGPGLECAYAHRMQTTKDHAPFEDVLRAAGVTIPTPPSRAPPSIKGSREDKRLEKHDEAKKPRSLRKSRPSIGNPIGQVTPSARTHARGQTIDVVSAPIAEVHLSFTLPTSVSTPQLPFKISQVNGAERRRSHRRRRSTARVSTVDVISDTTPPTTAEPFMQSKVSPLESTGGHENEVKVPASHVSATPLYPSEQGAYNYAFPPQNSDPHSPLTAPESDTEWEEYRHRSLQKIKEKRNARRGLSQFDERQVSTSSMSLVKSTSIPVSASTTRSNSRSSRSHSRSLSSSNSLSSPNSLPPSHSIGPVTVSRSATTSSQSRYHRVSIERTRPRARNGSTSGVSARIEEDERAVQSDSGMTIMQREGSTKGDFCEAVDHGDDNDEIVLFGRETKMNNVDLSRDFLARRECKEDQAGAEMDVETVSDKTMVHQ